MSEYALNFHFGVNYHRIFDMFAVKSGTDLEMFTVIFGTGKIYKFINRTFEKENLF